LCSSKDNENARKVSRICGHEWTMGPNVSKITIGLSHKLKDLTHDLQRP